MRKHTFASLLLVLFVLALSIPGSAQEVVPSIGASVSGAGKMLVSNPDLAINGGLLVKVGPFLTQHTLQFDTKDNTVAGHDASAMTYDGSVLFEATQGGLAFGGGVRTTLSDGLAFESTIVRPYIAIAQRTDKGFSRLELIGPGNDGWREQYGVLLQDDLGVITIDKHHIAITLTAGAFSYHESPGTPEVIFQSTGVTKYQIVDSPRKFGGMIGIGLKYYFK